MAHEKLLKHLRQAQEATDQLRAYLDDAMKAAESYHDAAPEPESSTPARPSLLGRESRKRSEEY